MPGNLCVNGKIFVVNFTNTINQTCWTLRVKYDFAKEIQEYHKELLSMPPEGAR